MNPRVVPAYLLKSYAWSVIKNNSTLKESDYGGLVPVVPLAEEPELAAYDKPHIVYGYAQSSTGELHARRTGSMSFAIYSKNFGEITTLLNILSVAFGRQDESARDINKFTSKTTQFLGIRFGTVEIGFVEGGTPEETEGGRQSGIINITFEYYVDYEVITDPSQFA
jgi:hypothetical protein